MTIRPWVLVIGLLVWAVLIGAIVRCDPGTAPAFRFEDDGQ